MNWRRSSKCEAGACAEVAWADGQAFIRVSTSGNLIHMTREEFKAFKEGMILGEFDEERP